MKMYIDSRAKRAIIGISAVALLTFAAGAGAMQEYGDLKTLVAETEAGIQELDRQLCDAEVLCILGLIISPEVLHVFWMEADRLESEAMTPLSIALVETETAGDSEATAFVCKQMQKIKQAAQTVRNRILAIRSASSMALEIYDIPVFMKVGMYVQMTSGPTATLRTQANRRSTVKAQDL